jgi:hypothetical protein
MKKLIYLIAIALCSCSNPSFTDTETKCRITEVQYFPIGSINTVQVDPVWKAKTSCNFDISSRHKLNVGDTITIIKRKFN